MVDRFEPEYAKKPMSQRSAVKKLFVPSRVGYAPTLIHELEHARRKDPSGSSYHNKCDLPDGRERADFETCANEFVLAAGGDLLINWHKQLPNIAEKHFGNIENAEKLIKELITILDDDEKGSFEDREKFLLRKMGVLEQMGKGVKSA